MTNATSARMLTVPWRSARVSWKFKMDTQGRSSNRIILKIKEILTGDTFFIPSTKRAERPPNNSWLLPGSFKAVAVTWISLFYFIRLYVSATQTILSLGRQAGLRLCVRSEDGGVLWLRPSHAEATGHHITPQSGISPPCHFWAKSEASDSRRVSPGWSPHA